ncbi:MAG: ChbG/HpnK family deacetylase [Bdellovibrionota bacterium]
MITRSAIITMALLLAAAALPVYTIKTTGTGTNTDFEVYYRAAQRIAVSDWNTIYTLTDGASPFRYAPPLLPLFAPLKKFDFHTARLVWFYLQFIFFAGGFFFIFKSAKLLCRKNNLHPLVITCLTMLFVYRFCLDTFMIGQVSGLLFLGLSMALYGWLAYRPATAGLGLFFPAAFKLGPGLAYLLILSNKRFRARAFFAPLILFAVLNAVLLFMSGSWQIFKMLWASWANIVTNDSLYYDASHYGSQSLKSALLRLANIWPDLRGIFMGTYQISAVLGCLAILLLWLGRRPRSRSARALFFSISIFAYLWFMPETFKYNLTALALPITILLALPNRGIATNIILFLGFITLSASGKDIVGDLIFFTSQRVSLPLLTITGLGLVTFMHLWKRSKTTYLVSSLIHMGKLGSSLGTRGLGPWHIMPARKAELAASVIITFPADKAASQVILSFTEEAKAALKKLFGESYEIITAPSTNKGRATALREAFLISRGEKIFVCDAANPINPIFFSQATDLLNKDYDFIRGNRRLPDTKFKIPVRLLPLAYSRHRLGLFFNKLVRFTLPITTTDTHSGTFGCKRQLALEIFSLQTSPDFLFDLELCIVAATYGARETELPLNLLLAAEKSVRRMAAETLSIFLGLPVLFLRYRLGRYSPVNTKTKTHMITADDWGMSPAINDGILELAKCGIIKRVSLLADSAYLGHRLDELIKISGIKLGLHFNLTYGKTVKKPSTILTQWMNPFLSKTSLREHVRTEFKSQLSLLYKAGINATYLDGHHHIHVVPGILDSIADLMKQAGIRTVRCPYDRDLLLSTKFPIALLAAASKKRIKQHGFEYLPFFYPRKKHFMDHGLMRSHLSKNTDFEVMVHPASSDDHDIWLYSDTYIGGRVLEFRALSMLRFSAYVNEARIT